MTAHPVPHLKQKPTVSSVDTHVRCAQCREDLKAYTQPQKKLLHSHLVLPLLGASSENKSDKSQLMGLAHSAWHLQGTASPNSLPGSRFIRKETIRSTAFACWHHSKRAQPPAPVRFCWNAQKRTKCLPRRPFQLFAPLETVRKKIQSIADGEKDNDSKHKRNCSFGYLHQRDTEERTWRSSSSFTTIHFFLTLWNENRCQTNGFRSSEPKSTARKNVDLKDNHCWSSTWVFFSHLSRISTAPPGALLVFEDGQPDVHPDRRHGRKSLRVIFQSE